MEAFIIEILKNGTYSWWIMAFLIFILSQIFKLPIKYFTKKLPENIRKSVNSVILLIPLGLGVLAMYLYNTVLLPFLGVPALFDLADGFILGSQSIAFYGVFERFLGKKIFNPYTETEEGGRILNQLNKITADGKVTKDEAKSLVKNSILSEDEQKQIQNSINPSGE